MLLTACICPDSARKATRFELPRENPKERFSTYAFRDSSEPSRGYWFFFNGRELFLSRYGFPGYDELRWYHVTDLTKSLAELGEYWALVGLEGDTIGNRDNFYSRQVFLQGKERSGGLEYISERSWVGEEFADWVEHIKETYCVEQFRVYEMPWWLSSDGRIDMRFGLMPHDW